MNHQISNSYINSIVKFATVEAKVQSGKNLYWCEQTQLPESLFIHSPLFSFTKSKVKRLTKFIQTKIFFAI